MLNKDCFSLLAIGGDDIVNMTLLDSHQPMGIAVTFNFMLKSPP